MEANEWFSDRTLTQVEQCAACHGFESHSSLDYLFSGFFAIALIALYTFDDKSLKAWCLKHKEMIYQSTVDATELCYHLCH